MLKEALLLNLENEDLLQVNLIMPSNIDVPIFGLNYLESLQEDSDDDLSDSEDEDFELVSLKKRSTKSKKGKGKKTKKETNEVCREMKEDAKKNPMYKKKGAFYQQAKVGYNQFKKMSKANYII